MGSGSAAAEHLTNPAEGKRPREMPTESSRMSRDETPSRAATRAQLVDVVRLGTDEAAGTAGKASAKASAKPCPASRSSASSPANISRTAECRSAAAICTAEHTTQEHNNQTHTRSETSDASGGLADCLAGPNRMRRRGLARPGRDIDQAVPHSGTLDEPGWGETPARDAHRVKTEY